MKELLQVVDEHDNPIGAETKDVVWRNGLWHRVARVLVYNEADELLVQQRGDKPLFPFRWAESVGGHVEADRSYYETAQREADEEVGIRGLSLVLLGKYPESAVFQAREPVGRIILNKFEQTYKTVVPKGAVSQFTPTGEVRAIEWWSKDHVVDFVSSNPDEVTDGLENMVRHYLT